MFFLPCIPQRLEPIPQQGLTYYVLFVFSPRRLLATISAQLPQQKSAVKRPPTLGFLWFPPNPTLERKLAEIYEPNTPSAEKLQEKLKKLLETLWFCSPLEGTRWLVSREAKRKPQTGGVAQSPLLFGSPNIIQPLDTGKSAVQQSRLYPVR